MKIKNTIQTACLLLTSTLITARASNVIIPSGSFEGITTNLNVGALLSTTNNYIGAWSASLTSVLTLGGSIKSGTATSLSGPTPLNGTNELDVHLPVGVGTTATLSQTLTNKWLPNSTYILSVGLDQVSTANLLANSTLSLLQGTAVASLSGTTLVGLVTGGAGLQTVTLTYKTSNVVPTNNVGISLSMPGVLALGGDIYVDNFQLHVVPNQVALNSVAVSHGTGLTLSGSGGAPSEQYQVETTTNLTTLTWSPMLTNQFDVNGNFSLQIAVNTNTPARFFRVYLP